MRSVPSISVLVAFCDAVAFLDDAVRSVLVQDCPDWELLLCNDGSSDGSLERAHDWQATDPRIRVLSHAGNAWRGTGATRALGLAAARGEFVSWLDADDEYRPSKLREQQALLRRHPAAALVYGPLELWDPVRGRSTRQPLGVAADQVHAPPLLLLRLLSDERFIPSGSMLRRQALEQVGGYDASFTRFYEDTLTTARICLRFPVLATGTSWYRYRQHAGSVTAQVTRVDGDRVKRRFLDQLMRDALSLDGCPEIVLRAITAERARTRSGPRDWLRHWRRSFQRGFWSPTRRMRTR